MNNDLLKELKWDSTHKLVFFAILSFGIYPVFYIKRQSQIFNSHFESERISMLFVLVLLLIIIFGAVFTIFSFINLENVQVSKINNILGFLAESMMIFWASKFRNRINKSFNYSKGNPEYFKAWYTFLFSLFYINYKINQINELKKMPGYLTKSDS